MKKIISLGVILICLAKFAMAQIPAGYYNAANGISGGTTLLNVLKGIIDNHTAVLYANVELSYPSTDKKANGKVWDMYSYSYSGSQPYEYSFATDQCGNYNSEGDCFNKEHLWPQSLFAENMPMRSDLHHLPPTDGWVNNKRSNYPFGEISNITWTSLNGSKLGYGNTYNSYSGLLFEPIDSFKGDIARSLMYMSCRYNGEANSWSDWAMANNNVLTADAITLLLKWHHDDPVSQKEINRNNAIHLIQKNRNPFIDEPKYADCIWGNTTCNGTIPVAIASIDQANCDIFCKGNSLNITNTNEQIPFIHLINCVGQFITVPCVNNVASVEGIPTGIYTAAFVLDGAIIRKKFFKD
jgi:endonuclease I